MNKQELKIMKQAIEDADLNNRANANLADAFSEDMLLDAVRSLSDYEILSLVYCGDDDAESWICSSLRDVLKKEAYRVQNQ